MGENDKTPGVLTVFEKVDKYVAIIAAIISAATFTLGNRFVSYAFIILASGLLDTWLWRLANSKRALNAFGPQGETLTVSVYTRPQSVLLRSAAFIVTASALTWIVIAIAHPEILSATPSSTPSQTLATEPTTTSVPRMVLIPAGIFAMGTDQNLDTPEPKRASPKHMVFLGPYSIDKYEVTNKEYFDFIKATNHSAPKDWIDNKPPQLKDNYPVVWVTWNDAQDYCSFRGERLPTEAEWEKAARGTDGRTWPWGNDDPMPELAHIGDNNIYDAVPIGSYPKGISPYGLYDMAGNVSEWVYDWYEADFYTLTVEKPHGPPFSPDNSKVVRGGAYTDTITNAKTYYRVGLRWDITYQQVGFRCVMGDPIRDH